MPKQIGKIKTGYDQTSRIHSVDGDSPTVTTPSGGGHIPVIKTKQPRVRPECILNEKDNSFTITASNCSKNSNNKPFLEVSNTVNCDGYLERGARNRDKNGKAVLTSQCDRRIRRLTPLECERLQGYDDNYTKFGRDKNGNIIEISDTQRYRMMGNAVSEIIPKIIGERLIKG